MKENLATQARHCFIAFTAEQLTAEKLVAFTPRLMRWTDDVWLMDLTPCVGYWEQRAKFQGVSLAELMRRVCARLELANYRMSVAANPWQSLLLLRMMQTRQLQGTLSLHSKLAYQLYLDISWSDWLSLAREVSEHFTACQFRGFKAQTFLSNLRMLERAVTQLGLSKVSQFNHLSSRDFQRRFGAMVKDLWQWTWEGVQTTYPQRITSDGFPWHGYQIEEAPTVTRHLEQPLANWSEMEPILRDDLNRLCVDKHWDQQERVVRLEWRLVLTDLTTLSIPIHFRHPHFLHRAYPQQKAALLQAYYSFQSVLQKDTKGSKALSVMDYGLMIGGWTLILAERIYTPPALMSLFGDDETEETRLSEIENCLPVALESYQECPDWVVDDALKSTHVQVMDQQLCTPRSPWRHLARWRPLYIYEHPKPLEEQKHSSLWRFSERTMMKWWQEPSELAASEQSVLKVPPHKDYYAMTDAEKRHWWVYRDATDRWYIHGVFG